MLRILETLEEFDSPQQINQESRKPRNERNAKPKRKYNFKRKNSRQHSKYDKEKGTIQRTLVSYFITETAIGMIVLTITIPKHSKRKQTTGRKRRKAKRIEGLEKK